MMDCSVAKEVLSLLARGSLIISSTEKFLGVKLSREILFNSKLITNFVMVVLSPSSVDRFTGPTD